MQILLTGNKVFKKWETLYEKFKESFGLLRNTGNLAFELKHIVNISEELQSSIRIIKGHIWEKTGIFG